MARPVPFKLLPFFAVTSLIGILAAAALVTLLYRHTAVAALVELGERQNIALAQTALSSAHQQLADYLRHSNANGGRPLTDGEADTLEASLDAVRRSSGVVRIKTYNRFGVVIFSTKRSQIGRDQGNNPAFNSALHGQIASKLVYHATFNYFDQETEEDNLIQTYLPVGMGPQGVALGVFEIYTDMNPLVRVISRMELMIVAGTCLIFLMLYGLLLVVVRRASTTITRQQLTIAERNQALERLSAQLLDAQEAERKQVALELHEGIAQTLAAIKFRLETSTPLPGDAVQSTLVKAVQGAIQEVRTMAMRLRPPSLDGLGLGATLRWLARQLSSICPGIPVDARISVGEDRIPQPLRVIVYRVAEDALAAMIRLDAARTIQLALHELDGRLMLAITDPALVATAPLGPDLSLACERILMAGGTFALEAAPAGGATLRAQWEL